MKITDSTLSLQSVHKAEVREVSRESLTLWRRGEAAENREASGVAVGRLRQRAMALLQRPPVEVQTPPAVTTTEAVEAEEEPLDSHHALEVSLLKLLVERITGRSIQVLAPGDLASCEAAGDAAQSAGSRPAAAASEGEGWGMVYENYHAHYESEQTSFQAQGVVKTADGQEISLEIQLNMSREFFQEESTVLRAGDALKDPLVVNFSGQAVELTRRRFDFDIDADGVADQIRFVTPESGFLALDNNGDGAINDGSELFGAESGNGFADLAGFDSDANGWIDENDPVFAQLRIWSKDGEGRDQLVALGARGVGAIYLGHVTTPFEIKNDRNELLGQVRESGLYLSEEGVAGTLQQIDLVV